jgi:hypothetical protein
MQRPVRATYVHVGLLTFFMRLILHIWDGYIELQEGLPFSSLVFFIPRYDVEVKHDASIVPALRLFVSVQTLPTKPDEIDLVNNNCTYP